MRRTVANPTANTSERESPLSFSIVTPCLNAVKTLEATLESVAAQDYPLVEHIVVDGGSTDGTLELLKSRREVRWISEPDEGLSDAVNKGIAMATGDLVGWLNADDLYHPGALAAVAEAFGKQPEAEWAFGRCGIIDGSGDDIRSGVTAYKNFFLRRYSFPLYLTHNFVSSPATFVKRGAYAEVGTFDKSFKYSMDYDVWLRLARRGRPIFIDAELASFRMAEGSLSMSGFETQFVEHYESARPYAAEHPFAVRANAIISRLIVLAYRVMRFIRGRKA
jgi:glycosyltransferase involved in cell wall biosynthesis